MVGGSILELLVLLQVLQVLQVLQALQAKLRAKLEFVVLVVLVVLRVHVLLPVREVGPVSCFLPLGGIPRICSCLDRFPPGPLLTTTGSAS